MAQPYEINPIHGAVELLKTNGFDGSRLFVVGWNRFQRLNLASFSISLHA
jgi:hypothetical protein